MLDRTYPDQVCSIARALEVVGERWSVLIVRDAFLGRSRFSEFQRSLGIARNVLDRSASRTSSRRACSSTPTTAATSSPQGPRARAPRCTSS